VTPAELRRDALQAGIAVMAAPAPSPALQSAYTAALAALPFQARCEVADMIGAVVEAQQRLQPPTCRHCGKTP
jgi:hypothetical protein